jgi:hypothetical protein
VARRTPPKGFESSGIELASIKTGTKWFRLYSSRYPDPLGFGFSPSRFSDPRVALPEKDRFGVIYFGSSLKVCFLERILRDIRNGRPHGIVYYSRLNDEINMALYNVALPSIRVSTTRPLLEYGTEVAGLIREFKLAIV